MPGIYRTTPANGAPEDGQVQITTVWKACGGDTYMAPYGTAAAFYGSLLLIALLVVALWVWARKRDLR